MKVMTAHHPGAFDKLSLVRGRQFPEREDTGGVVKGRLRLVPIRLPRV